MVFKPINLARQSFVKTFTHGYAQSLVAASQSSSASQNASFHNLSSNVANFFGKAGPSNNIQTVPLTQSNQTGSSAKAGQPDNAGNEGGLAAYYAAWQTHQKVEEKEWHQFQFAKRIGWKAPTTIPDVQTKSKQNIKAGDTREVTTRIQHERSPTPTSSDDTVRARRSSLTQNATLPQDITVDNQESQVHKSLELPTNQEVSVGQSIALDSVPFAEESVTSSSPVPNSTLSENLSTEATSVSEVETYTQRLTDLAEAQHYADIPAVFEGMLVAGFKPTSSAYNALLLAAINLPRGKHQVVPKVLDVYGDMLRRRVLPDTSTYAILIELLAARALDVTAMKKELVEKQSRYGGGSFLFRSDETEYKILNEDDALSIAIRIFDTSAAVSMSHVFPAETYRLLICACAELGRIGDMVRIYADMESQQIVPPTAIFAPMVQAFAGIGDLRSSVECYNEYKALAIAHDRGERIIVRKDEEIYAAIVKAYAIVDRMTGGLKFLGKIEDTMENSQRLPLIRNTVALQTLHPHWLAHNRHTEALAHAIEKLDVQPRRKALTAVCCDAADKNLTEIAAKAFALLDDGTDLDELRNPTMAMLAMYVRVGNISGADTTWLALSRLPPSVAFVEPTTMYVLSLIASGDVDKSLRHSREMFANIRNVEAGIKRTDAIDQINEAIEIISERVIKAYSIVPPTASVEMISMMVENGDLVPLLAERLLAGLGPEEITPLPLDDVLVLMEVEAGMLVSRSALQIAHAARFAHLFEIIVSGGVTIRKSVSKLVEEALTKLDRPDLMVRWQNYKHAVDHPLLLPVQYASIYPPPPPVAQPAYGELNDPYSHLTDFKGSTAIAEELEKAHGRHGAHLKEALSKFKNMRRVGRHPRYITYAKLISAAAKEDQISLAHDILAMARQDVPLLPQSRAVRHGWITILDAMVGACLTVGQRDLANHFHQDLLNLGSAPSANTFGLYITTLKESAKMFDEATEAVKIFHRAKSEGVEPSSFLYNALIGKLGKARRIDDCLFYFAEMRNIGIKPTSVTYGTIVNALCRVSDEKFAEELFEEMESMSNYKPRPAPYNSLMQYFLTTKRDRSKVLVYYERMKANNITPTMHTYKLLMDTYATLEPVDMTAAEKVLDDIRSSGAIPEAVHYASLIHAKGCVLHDIAGARAVFDSVLAEGQVPAQASLYQALFESMVANHEVAATEPLLKKMAGQGVGLTPYIANTLIHGWATEKDISKARDIFNALGLEKREPSTYEAMTRAYLASDDHANASLIVREALRRGYPSAVASKISELVGGGPSRNGSIVA